MKKPLLFLAYYLIITPIGAVQRLLHDPMQRRIQRETESYWTVAPVRR